MGKVKLHIDYRNREFEARVIEEAKKYKGEPPMTVRCCFAILAVRLMPSLSLTGAA